LIWFKNPILYRVSYIPTVVFWGISEPSTVSPCLKRNHMTSDLGELSNRQKITRKVGAAELWFLVACLPVPSHMSNAQKKGPVVVEAGCIYRG